VSRCTQGLSGRHGREGNKNKTNNAGYLMAQCKKIFSLAVAATKIFFANTHQKTFLINLIQDDLS
jgi:hypothetical protein